MVVATSKDDEIPLGQVFLVGLFGVVLVLGVESRRRGLESILSTPTIALCLGIAFSAIVVYGGAGKDYQRVLAFNPNVFLYALLPTIIIDAALNCNRHLFLLNFGTILCMATLGTTGAAFIIGVLQWAFGQAGIAYQMPFLYNLLFGCIVAATDPVTTLAVFQALEADGNLFINVFGEAVLNDAVAQVLYETISNFLPFEGHEAVPVNARSVWRAIGIFIGIFTGSIAMGLAFGFVNAGFMRTGHFRTRGSVFETGIVVVFLYASYFSASVAHISGITTLLFCGMIVRAYSWPNMSHEARLLVHSTFEMLASLLEPFLSMYMATTLFTMETFNVWRFAALCLISVAAARLGALIPCLGVPNLLRPAYRRMDKKILFLIWWSGLRGAMAFALGTLAAQRFGLNGEVMQTTVFYIAFLTVLINGGSTKWFVQKMKLTEAERLSSAAWLHHNEPDLADPDCKDMKPPPEDADAKPPLPPPSYCPWESSSQTHTTQDPLPYKPWEEDPTKTTPNPPQPPNPSPPTHNTSSQPYKPSTPLLGPHHTPSHAAAFNVDASAASAHPAVPPEQHEPQQQEPQEQEPQQQEPQQFTPSPQSNKPAHRHHSTGHEPFAHVSHAKRGGQLLALDMAPLDNPRRMRVDYQRRLEEHQLAINEEAQPLPKVSRRRNPLQWMQSKNLWFFDLMMWIDCKILSKWLIPPEEEPDAGGHGHAS